MLRVHDVKIVSSRVTRFVTFCQTRPPWTGAPTRYGRYNIRFFVSRYDKFTACVYNGKTSYVTDV